MARFLLENSKGGVKAQDGKTRTFVFAGTKDDKGRVCQDDKLDRDTNRQKIKDMVEGEKVFALMPVTSNGFFAGDYLNEKHIPYSGFGFQLDYCGPDKPFAFGAGGALACDPLGDHTFVSTALSSAVFEACRRSIRRRSEWPWPGAPTRRPPRASRSSSSRFEATGATVVTADNSLPGSRLAAADRLLALREQAAREEPDGDLARDQLRPGRADGQGTEGRRVQGRDPAVRLRGRAAGRRRQQLPRHRRHRTRGTRRWAHRSATPRV